MIFQQSKIIPTIVISSVLLIGVIVTSYVATHGFINVSIKSSDAQPKQYILTNQDNGDTQVYTNSSNNIKKMVRKGNYEVSILQTGRSAWLHTRVSGLLHTSKIDTNLKNESGREFVGNNPAPCSYYLDNRLITFECQRATSLTEHIPATATTPTYAQVIKNLKIGDTVAGIVKTGAGPVIIIRSHDIESDTDLVSAATLDGAGNLTDQTSLDGVDSSKEYIIASYRNGFVLYSSDLKSVASFESIHSKAQVVDMSNKRSGLKPLGLTASDKGLVAYYSSVDASDDPDPKAHITSEVITNSDNVIQHYTFDTALTKASFCGTKLCILSDNTLNVYETLESGLHFDYEMSGINDLQTSMGTMYLENKYGILMLDDQASPNHYMYTFNDYRSCGVGLNSNIPVVCLLTPRHDKVSVLLQGSLDNYPIDRSVLTLLKDKRIQNVSAYQKYIYLTPEVGKLTYDSNVNSFNYSDKQKATSIRLIDDLVISSKLNRSTYNVIDTLNP